MLSLHLEINKSLDELSQSDLDQTPNYDDQYDDATSVIIDLCDILEEEEIVCFRVKGFGQNNWPVDVATDLSSILEQLPEVIDSIHKENYPCHLDFYEQGIERKLVFEKSDKLVKITCYSRTSWIPSPTFILENKEYILSMFIKLKSSFVEVANKVCPQLSASDLFIVWYDNSL
ncbi:MAG: hypothetical protein WBA77_00455 [Microcoleaceae cyanobacterium]